MNIVCRLSCDDVEKSRKVKVELNSDARALCAYVVCSDRGS